MKIWKRLFGMALCLCAAACVMSVSASAAGEHTDHYNCGVANCENTNHGHSEVTTWIEVKQTDVSESNGLTLEAGKSYYLGEDIEVKYAINIKGTVNLCLNGHSITKTTESNTFYGVITVGDNSTFTLCNCKTGGTITHASGKTGRGVRIGSSSPNSRTTSFIMYGGTISGNRTNNQDGAGVLVQGASFQMYGGKISDNHIEAASNNGGGGVCAHSGGKFIMSGGEISGNTSNDGGGISVVGSTFKMHGGTISGNTASKSGGGVDLWNASYALSDGEISGNTATENGGGVYFSAGESETLDISGTMKIEGNSADDGGGIYVDKASLVMTGGSISNNNVTGTGGGVYFNGDTFNLDGCVSITGNKKGGIPASGGLSGGTDNNVYLPTGKVIAVMGELTGSVIGVTTEAMPSSSGYVRIATGSQANADPTKFKYENNPSIEVIRIDRTLVACEHSWGTVWSSDSSGHWHECSICSGRKDTGEHDYNQQSADAKYLKSDATCTARAVYYKSCVCGAKGPDTFETGDALGHTDGTPVIENKVDADCTEAGSYDEVVYCTTCSSELSRTPKAIPAPGHDWGSWVMTVPATEEADGKETRTCHRDPSHTDTRSIPKLPHVHSLVHYPAAAANCGTNTEGNTEYWSCSGCGKVFRDAGGVYEVDHDTTVIRPAHAPAAEWSSDEGGHWHVCENNCGQKLDPAVHLYDDAEDAVCNVCGYTRPVTPPHTHDLRTVPAVPATCTSAGNIGYYRCEDCGGLFRDSEGTQALTEGEITLDKLPHSPEVIPAVPASCEQAGLTAGSRCSVCQEVITAPTTVPAPGHDWQPAACDTPEACARCHAARGEALGHDWGRYTVTTPATEDREGVETRTCTRDITHTQSRAIPKLPARTYGISGEVVKNDRTPAAGAVVTLVLGDRQIASVIADSEGTYRFTGIVPGIYNLIAKLDGVTMTVKAEVVRTDITVDTVVMPAGKTSSVVEVRSADAEESVEAVVGNLEKIFEASGDDKPFTANDQSTVMNGGSVEIRLTVTKTDMDAVADGIRQQLSDDADIGLRLDLEVSKTVTPSSGTQTITTVTDTGILLETVIRLPAVLQGKDSYTVYRLHGAQVHKLTAAPNANGEFIEVSADKTAITIHARLYSEYVIAYQSGSSGNGNSGGNGGGHAPSVPANAADKAETGRTDERTCPQDSTCPIWPFADAVPSAWYHDGVHYCVESGLMRGVSAAEFLPDAGTTRAQLVTILWRMEGSPEAAGSQRFTDVPGSAWYAGAVRWAADSGVIKGYDDGRFGSDDALTREQMVTILYRYAQYKRYDVSISGDTNILSFTDAPAVSGYAVSAMQWGCGAGLVNGIAQNGGMILAPADTTTRAQIATLVMRFERAFAKEA